MQFPSMAADKSGPSTLAEWKRLAPFGPSEAGSLVKEERHGWVKTMWPHLVKIQIGHFGWSENVEALRRMWLSGI